MNTPAEELTTPQLVREYADRKVMAATSKGKRSYAEHHRLSEVVTELRVRKVLD